MTTRYLLCCISAFYYDGEKTLDDVHAAIAEDAKKLYYSGIHATRFDTRFPAPFVLQAGSETIHFVSVGAKGDWVWLRKDRS